VSFLSRFIGSNKKKNINNLDSDASQNDPSEHGDLPARPEGTDAQLFTQSHMGDNVGFQPRHPKPPSYIRVKAKFKKEQQYDKVFLAQELRAEPTVGLERSKSRNSEGGVESKGKGSNAIWALEFSRDGKYLAAAGQDEIVRVWAVISSQEERRAHEKEEEEAAASNGSVEQPHQHLSAPVFKKKVFRQYEGHTSTVVDLSWSKNNFLLSSSFDKSVRLWHVSRNECLCTFKHVEYVPSIQFHPRDDRFFLAGSLDSKLRLWSIPDKAVAYWTPLPEMISAVSFTPDGTSAIAGTTGGQVHFFQTEGLKHESQFSIRPNARGRNAKQSNQITGIRAITIPHVSDTDSGNSKADVKLLISSKDSRIRMYNTHNYTQEMKFKGHKNDETQIRATFSSDGTAVISGSEDKKCYIWSTGPSEAEKNQRPLEYFEANDSMTLWAILAPVKTRQLLGQSEDPVYDVCNPPPVTLISRAESVTSSQQVHSKPASEAEQPSTNGTGSVQNTPRATPADSTFKRVEPSSTYISRSTHHDGQIIVTASFDGSIKIFRQDCAASKRKPDQRDWDTASLISNTKSRLSRRGSLSARHSVTSVSRRRTDSTSTLGTQPPNERIMSWRQGVGSTGSFDSARIPLQHSRSNSPRKSAAQLASSASAAASSRTQLYHKDSNASDVLTATSTTHSSPLRQASDATDITSGAPQPASSSSPAATAAVSASAAGNPKRTPSNDAEGGVEPATAKASQRCTAEDPLWLAGGQSNMFWNAAAGFWNRGRSPSERKRQGSERSPGREGGGGGGDLRKAAGGGGADESGLLAVKRPGMGGEKKSYVSALSSEEASEYEDAEDGGEQGKGEGEIREKGRVSRCRRCDGKEFKARLVGGEQRLCCARCGTAVGE